MERRSSADRHVHFGGNIVSNVESSHGVEISGGSTGGVIESFGDDTNVSLTIRAKNTGLLTLGNSSNRLNLVGSSINIGGASSIVIAPTSTAGVSIGNSSNPVVIGGSSLNLNSTHVNITSTRVQIGGGSTTALSGIQRYAIDFTPPVLAISEAAWQTYAVTGLSTASAVFISPHLTFSSNYGVSAPRCSTAGELSVLWTNHLASTIGTGESTNQWRVMEVRF